MQKDALLPRRLLLIGNFVIVRRRMFTRRSCSWAELGWAQAETSSCPYTEVICRILLNPWVNLDSSFRVHLQTERQCCVQSLVGLSVPPPLNGRSVWGATWEEPAVLSVCHCSKFTRLGLIFILHHCTQSWEEWHPAALLRLSCRIGNACS